MGRCLVVLAVLCLGCSGETETPGPAGKDLHSDDVRRVDGSCVPTCGAAECGSDGCGGSCGNCGPQELCNGGKCEPATQCSDGEPCDDGNPCTSNDECVQDLCVGAKYECSDGKECTEDICDGDGECSFEVLVGRCLINGVCYQEGEFHPDKPCRECMTSVGKTQWSNDDTNTCSDDDECTIGDYCFDGDCEPGGELLDCNDSNACTSDACDPDAGCLHADSDIECDDGNLCTHNDGCALGECLGQPVDCNDGNPCTSDTCEPATGCKNENTGGDCDDGNVCTVGDSCDGGECSPGGAVMDCDDGNVCTDDSCDPATGCLHLDNVASCDDGDKCTGGDICGGGECNPGTQPLDCNDNSVCTSDSCSPATGCLHVPLEGLCDDGSICTGGDYCMDGGCKPGEELLSCDDADQCTDDVCDPVEGCLHTLNSAPCSDGNECTEGDVCGNGVCAGTLKMCDDGNLCTSDSCNPFQPGGCVFDPNDVVCDDADPCTVGDSCGGGQCKAGTELMDCDDDNECTTDTCEPGAGCSNKNFVGFCDDDDVCTQGDYCANGDCVPGAKICGCNKDAHCLDKEDGDQCNGTLYCDMSSQDPANWQCVLAPDSIVVCDDSQDTVCRQAQCIPQSGTCFLASINEGGQCDDADKCTTIDSCQNGACVGAGQLNCDDGDPCTIDLCSKTTGCLHQPAPEGSPCGGAGWTCTGGQCLQCSCAGKDCGNDGCGGSCGSCPQEWLTCQGNKCAEPCPDLSGLWAFRGKLHYSGTCYGEWKSDFVFVEFVHIEKGGTKYELSMKSLPDGYPDEFQYHSCSFDMGQCRIECEADNQGTKDFYAAYAGYIGQSPWVSSGIITRNFLWENNGAKMETSYSLYANYYGSCNASSETWPPGDGTLCTQCFEDQTQNECEADHYCADYKDFPGNERCVPLCLTDWDCEPGFECYSNICWYESDSEQATCYQNDVWWQDQCGNFYDKKEDCSWDESCFDGQCF